MVNDTSTRFLRLNISWPGINNTDAMDFDYYTMSLSLWIVGENVYSFTGKTSETYYENIVYLTETTSNLTAQIIISAVNKCNNVNTLQVNKSLHAEDECTNYILNSNGSNSTCTPAPKSDSGSDSSSKYAIILIISLAGLLIFHLVLGRSIIII